jgi:glycosyltransferase involved in cell wall biosynthesis
MNPSVSVIIPAYNADKYITRALDSVANQTLAGVQAVVVDDGSKDSTAAVVQDWIAGHSLPVHFASKANGGAASARNEGFRHAVADLTAFLDADDYMHPHHLESLVTPFRQHSGVVLSFGIAEVRDHQDRLIRLFPDSRVDHVIVETGPDDVALLGPSVYSSLIGGSYIATSATLMSRNAAALVGFMDSRLRQSEDRDFWMRLARVGQLAFVRRLVTTKRDHETNTTHPRHKYRTLRSALYFLEKLNSSTESPGLSQDELRRAREALRETLSAVVYFGSRRGLRAFIATAIDLAAHGHISHVFQPRPWCRALACSLNSTWRCAGPRVRS